MTSVLIIYIIYTVAEQQEFYKKIIHVQTLIAEKDREVNQLAGQLKDVELTLQSVLDESKAELESLEKAEKSKCHLCTFTPDIPYFNLHTQK